MTDPAVSPFALIREALILLDRVHSYAAEETTDSGLVDLLLGVTDAAPAATLAALDQLQRDHEALVEENSNLRASLELEVASSHHARQKDNAYLIEQRDAAVREAETLRKALRQSDEAVSAAHDVVWASYPGWEGEDGRREPLNASLWRLHEIIRAALAFSRDEQEQA